MNSCIYNLAITLRCSLLAHHSVIILNNYFDCHRIFFFVVVVVVKDDSFNGWETVPYNKYNFSYNGKKHQ